MNKLFYKCAYEIEYETIGNDVNYAFEEENDTLFIFFEASSSLVDWFRNFSFSEKVYKMFRVHKGFYQSYKEVRNVVLDKCYSKDYKKIVIVGYSHGGALVQISFEDIKYHFPNAEIVGYAFESPRALKVKKEYRHLWNGLYVIRNNNDLITHLPPRLFGYRHLGEMIKIKGDTSVVKNFLPKCIKSHYPECVMNGLEKYENKLL